MDIAAKTALITGAGSGIGRATAVEMAQKGVRLALCGRRREALVETQRLANAQGGDAVILPGDVSDNQWREDVMDEMSLRFGGADILVNSAGVVSAGALEDMDPDDVRAQIEVDLIAPILLIRAALPALRASEAAAIVNISSSIGLVGQPFYSAYAASKGGLSRFSAALRRELSDSAIHVMTVYPVATDTPMMDSADGGDNDYEDPKIVANALVAGLENNEIDVIRGGARFEKLHDMNHRDPTAADRRIERSKPQLRERASGHRSM